MTIKNCPNCGGTHYGSIFCPLDGPPNISPDDVCTCGRERAEHKPNVGECLQFQFSRYSHKRFWSPTAPPAVAGVPGKREIERHPDLLAAVQKTWGRIYNDGLTLAAWNEMIAEIERALVTERNESYVRGMHDEHNEPLGDRLPPLPPSRF